MSDRTALLFPGQGSQSDGMGEDIRRWCPDLFHLALEAVGDDPFERAGEGTEYAQPALYCASFAAWTRAGRPGAELMAGHSLGELAALAAAGAIAPDDGLRIAVLRGRAMSDAARAAPAGGMLALLGGELDHEELAARHSLTVANDNAPGQIVVSGPVGKLEAAAAEARALGAKTSRLAVSGAFHSPAMAVAIPALEAALDRIEVRAPHTPVLSGVTAAPFDDIRRRLVEALVNPVRWRETLLALRESGTRRFIEVGPGKVLRGLVRRTLPDVEALLLSTQEAVGV